MKKIICFLVIFVMASFLLAGCTDKVDIPENSSNNMAADNHENKPVLNVSSGQKDTACEPEVIGADEMYKLAETIQKQLPEDVWGGYYLDFDWSDYELNLTLYIFLLKDCDNLQDYDHVVYKKVKYTQDELFDYFAVLKKNREEIGFYEASIDYPDNAVKLSVEEDRTLNFDLLRSLVPEDAYRIEYFDKGITEDVLSGMQQNLKTKKCGLDTDVYISSSDNKHLSFAFESDWIDNGLSLEGFRTLVAVKRTIKDYLDSFNAEVNIEVGDKAGEGNMMIWTKDTKEIKAGRISGLSYGNPLEDSDKETIIALSDDDFKNFNAASTISFDANDVVIEFRISEEYIDFYDLEMMILKYAADMADKGIPSDIIASVMNVNNETLYQIYYSPVYGAGYGELSTWVNPAYKKDFVSDMGPAPDTSYEQPYTEQPNNGEGYRVIKMDVRDVTPTGLTVVFRQVGDYKDWGLIYGDEYWLEKKEGDNWITVPTKIDEVCWNLLAYSISPEGESTKKENWEWLYSELSPGTYRMGKRVLEHREDGINNIYTLTKQFEIS